MSDPTKLREAIASTLMDLRMTGPWFEPPSTLTYQEAMRHYADIIVALPEMAEARADALTPVERARMARLGWYRHEPRPTAYAGAYADVLTDDQVRALYDVPDDGQWHHSVVVNGAVYVDGVVKREARADALDVDALAEALAKLDPDTGQDDWQLIHVSQGDDYAKSRREWASAIAAVYRAILAERQQDAATDEAEKEWAKPLPKDVP